MSYSESSDGQVTLTMSREDYDRLLICIGASVGLALQGKGQLGKKIVIELANRLNQGNPHYFPYQVEKS